MRGRPGLESWQPLVQVLEPRRAASPAPHASVREVWAAVDEPLGGANPATAKQRAFLSFMKVPIPANLSEPDAELLCAETSRDSKQAKRLAQWEEERLSLHPELFVTELQARTKDRPNFFHRKVISEGAECFTGVTKAHCQVLVGYLDLKYPHWDAKQSEATWSYFFPAVAEKFPQLVRKEWRSKLKFAGTSKVAPEIIDRRPARARLSRRAPGQWRAAAAGLAVLAAMAAFGAGVFAWYHPEALPGGARAQVNSLKAQTAAFVRGDEPSPARKPASGAPHRGSAQAPLAGGRPRPAASSMLEDGQPAGMPASEATAPTHAPALSGGDLRSAPVPSTMMSNGLSVTDPMVNTPPPTPPETSAEKPAGMSVPKPAEGLFDPNANTPPAPSATAPGMSSPSPTAETAGKSLLVTRPVLVQLAYGQVTIAAGTSLKLIAVEGDKARVNYLNSVIQIPVASTDLAVAR